MHSLHQLIGLNDGTGQDVGKGGATTSVKHITLI